jgi:hypothetical protein
MCDKKKAFNVTCFQWDEPKQYQVSPDCNSLTFVNKGTAQCNVNGFPLLGSPGAGFSGESFAIGGNECEIYEGIIDVQFIGVGTRLLVCVQKYYIKGK